MTTPKKKIPVWLIVMGIIASCVFIGLSVDRYTIVDTREPAWSRDGKYIAFACRPRNTLDRPPDYLDLLSITYGDQIYGVCVKDLNTGKISWITRRLGMHAPAWSSDGKSLAWMDSYDTLIVWNSVSRKSSKYPLGESCWPSTCIPSWSPDGRKIFLQGWYAWLDLDAEKLIFLDTKRSSQFSPTGRYIAYFDGRGESELHGYLIVQETQTNQTVFESRIASAASSILMDDISWSPDGSILAWVAVPERGNVQLGLTNILTGETSFLFINDLGRPTHNAWSLKGDSFLLESVGEEWNDVKVIQIVCESVPFQCKMTSHKLYKPRARDPDWYIWSPDGKKIAYQNNYMTGPVRIIDLETGQDNPLVEISK